MKLHTETYKGYTIEIHSDEDPSNPREEFDHMGTMVCFHRRYTLGDKHNFSLEDAQAFEETFDGLLLPLFLMDHSGLSISVRPFGCPWDSGRIGFIYVTRETIKKEYGNDSLESFEKAKKYLTGEAKDYDSYLRGDVYGYIVKDDEGNELDSCWGFIGDMEYPIEQAKEQIDWIAQNQSFAQGI